MPSAQQRAGAGVAAPCYGRVAVAEHAQPMQKPVQKQFRLLVLHGNKQNAEKFKRATSKAFRELDGHAELCFMSAPQSYAPAGSAAAALEGVDTGSVYQRGRNLVWWNASDDVASMEYRGLAESIAAVDAECRARGPFHGLLGFAQSACLAGVLAKLQALRCPEVQHCAFKFAILISGFPSRDVRALYNMTSPEESAATATTPTTTPTTIDIPTFHTWGERDSLIDPARSRALAARFAAPALAPHAGGHFSGAVGLWPVGEMLRWARGVMGIGQTEAGAGTGAEEVSLSPREIGVGASALPAPSPAGLALGLSSPLPSDGFPAPNTFEGKLSLTLQQNARTQHAGNAAAMWPFGLSRKGISSTPFWLQLYKEKPLYDTCGVTRQAVRGFIDECWGADGGAEVGTLVSDLLLVSFCLYPFETYAPALERKKAAVLRKAVQGEVFYWMFEHILFRVYTHTSTTTSTAAKAHSSILPAPAPAPALPTTPLLLHTLVDAARDWAAPLRLDLLLRCGGSRRQATGGADTDTPPDAASGRGADTGTGTDTGSVCGPQAVAVAAAFRQHAHYCIAAVLAARLALDRQLLLLLAGEGAPAGRGLEGGQGGQAPSYDEAVSTYLNISVAGKTPSIYATDATTATATATTAAAPGHPSGASLACFPGVSLCAAACPKLSSSMQRRTGLAADVAGTLAGILAAAAAAAAAGDAAAATASTTATAIAAIAAAAAATQQQGDLNPVRSRIEYEGLLRLLNRTIVARLSASSMARLCLLRAREQQAGMFDQYAACSDREYQDRVSALPLSRAVLCPEPEPVLLSAPEQLLPLHEYLQGRGGQGREQGQRREQGQGQGQRQGHSSTTIANGAGDGDAIADAIAGSDAIGSSNMIGGGDGDLIFPRGVVCGDGRLDLCKQVLYCTVLYSTVLRCTVLCCTVLCCTVLCCTVLCYAMLSCAMLCHAVLCYAMLCCSVLYYAVLCYAMLCCAILCYAMLCCRHRHVYNRADAVQ
jgi:hypothetical protein